MEVISKIILGIIQGITEIIPVSSSGHLILVSKLTGFELDLAFLTFLHLMTGLAIIWGFWDEIKYVFSSKQRSSLIKILFFAILPAILAGIFFHDYIENTLHNPFITISSLIGFGVLMIFVDSFFSDKGSIKKLEDVKARNAFLVGLAQIIALIPGTSRSGITIVSIFIFDWLTVNNWEFFLFNTKRTDTNGKRPQRRKLAGRTSLIHLRIFNNHYF